MANCKFCNQENLECYQDAQEKWKLGTKLDINNYRPHKCSPQEESNKRNWITINCEKCGRISKQNVKLMKSLNLNIGCNCHEK